MSNEYQSVEALVNDIKGTTGFLLSLFSQKSGMVFLFIVFSLIISKLLF
jgi:hypothetical protein